MKSALARLQEAVLKSFENDGVLLSKEVNEDMKSLMDRYTCQHVKKVPSENCSGSR